MSTPQTFLTHLEQRKLVAQKSHEDELAAVLSQSTMDASGNRYAVYAGFDPTAQSLHVGNLAVLMLLRRAQVMGLTPVILFGGATGLIGDPTGRTEMRKMRTAEEIQDAIDNFKILVEPLFEYDVPNPPVFVNNIDWTGPMTWLDFLRNVGVHFTVARLLSAEVNKSRLEHGLTFMELGYQLLQSYDFLHLNKNNNCILQVGGDDQWSNILGGADLIRRTSGKKAFALTTPLLAGSDGRKYGKSAGNAIWLDEKMTSSFELFQFFRNIADDDVGMFYRVFTFHSMEEVSKRTDKNTADINATKVQLAHEMVELLHNKAAADGAMAAAKALFSGGGSLQDAPTTYISQSEMDAGLDILALLVKCGLSGSKGEARKLIQGNGLSLNGIKHTETTTLIKISDFSEADAALVLKKGKKDFHRVKLG